MERRWRMIILIAALCLLTGCTLLPRTGPPTDPTPEVTETPGPKATQSPTSERTPTSVSITPKNPQGARTLTVGLVGATNDTANRTTPILAALAYWESNAPKYTGYNVSFRYAPTARTPDITIRFVDEIPNCELEDEVGSKVLGCVATPEDSASTAAEIRVLSGFTNDSTERILEHELGHVLGLSHGDEPEQTMNGSVVTAPLQLEYTYTVEDETSRHHPGQVYRQLRGMEQFLETGGGGTIPADVSIEEVDRRSDSDLVVVLTDDEDACPGSRLLCTDGSWNCLSTRSCRGTHGPTMTLERVKTEAIGWVIGRKLFRAILIDGGAVHRPVEFDPEETDPTRTWWV